MGIILGLFFFILVIICATVLITWLVRGTPAFHSYYGTGNRVMEILKERYARGEITKEQYENMKKDLL
jgi:putative membrane protein